MSTEAEVEAFVAKLTHSQSDNEAFVVIERESARLHEHILFTCLRFDYRDRVMSRLYSSREDVSPTGGTKPLPREPWADRLIEQGRSYVGRSREDLKEVFFDYEMLWGIGCESVMNVPVRWKNRTVGTINILGRVAQFDDASASRFSAYAQLAVPLFMSNLEGVGASAPISELVGQN